jgi:dUTP pyrophosphatase
MDVFEQIAHNLPSDLDKNSNEYFANLFFDEYNFQNYSVLKLFVNPENTQLIEDYKVLIAQHNEYTRGNPYYNSGFDLIQPKTTDFTKSTQASLFDLQVKGEMIHCKLFLQNDSKHPVAGMSACSPYYLYPRSSIYKTPLMLANHTGIIDAGYRGYIKAAIRALDDCTVTQGTRLFQICHPTLCPLYVVLVTEDQLTKTDRGEGGFGSTTTPK